MDLCINQLSGEYHNEWKIRKTYFTLKKTLWMFICILYFKIKIDKDWFLGERNRKKIVESGKNFQSAYKNLKHKVD